MWVPGPKPWYLNITALQLTTADPVGLVGGGVGASQLIVVPGGGMNPSTCGLAVPSGAFSCQASGRSVCAPGPGSIATELLALSPAKVNSTCVSWFHSGWPVSS